MSIGLGETGGMATERVCPVITTAAAIIMQQCNTCGDNNNIIIITATAIIIIIYSIPTLCRGVSITAAMEG